MDKHSADKPHDVTRERLLTADNGRHLHSDADDGCRPVVTTAVLVSPENPASDGWLCTQRATGPTAEPTSSAALF